MQKFCTKVRFSDPLGSIFVTADHERGARVTIPCSLPLFGVHNTRATPIYTVHRTVFKMEMRFSRAPRARLFSRRVLEIEVLEYFPARSFSRAAFRSSPFVVGLLTRPTIPPQKEASCLVLRVKISPKTSLRKTSAPTCKWVIFRHALD